MAGGRPNGRIGALLAGAVLLVVATVPLPEAAAIINPKLQPGDLYRRYQLVAACEITAVDTEKLCATLDVIEVHKGELPGDTVELRVAEALAGTLRAYRVGDRVVAFAGRKRPKKKRDEVLVYDGSWYLGQRKDAGWRLDATADQQRDDEGEVETMMAGTFNGDVDRFIELMADLRDGRAYMPSLPYAAFAPDVLLDQLDGEVLGLAIHDIDGDGRLDVYAASPDGDRAYLQLDDMEFTVATEVLGLAGVASRSCSFADADGDGDSDLLAGGQLYLAGAGLEDRFRRSNFRPDGRPPANSPEAIDCATFAAVDGDGHPDIVIALTVEGGGGLSYWRNRRDGTFVAEPAGLLQPACGRGRAGPFFAGDWNADGRGDLFFAADDGLLLLQDAKGRFAPFEHGIPLDFTGNCAHARAVTGAGRFAWVLGGGGPDLIVPEDDALHVIANRDGVPTDVTRHGNEISEASLFQMGLLVEDLNADGYQDIYTWTRKAGRSNRLHLYRGYGTFMNATKYDKDIFPGPTHEFGGLRCAAAADLNGDGAVDLVLGGADGAITLLVNDCLAIRIPEQHPTSERAALLATGRVTVSLHGSRGIVGARVDVRDSQGRVLGRRNIDGRGPARACFAIRNPGQHRLGVRYADGVVVTRPVEVVSGEHTHIDISRPPPPVEEDEERR